MASNDRRILDSASQSTSVTSAQRQKSLGQRNAKYIHIDNFGSTRAGSFQAAEGLYSHSSLMYNIPWAKKDTDQEEFHSQGDTFCGTKYLISTKSSLEKGDLTLRGTLSWN